MARSKGFRTEDYELAEAINDATNGRLRPSEACDLAETWIVAKLRREIDAQNRLGSRDMAFALDVFLDKLKKGVH